MSPVVIGAATLYNADCRDVLPTLGRVDAVVTDPPYGIGFRYAGVYSDQAGEEYRRLLAPLRGLPLALLQYPEEMMREVVPVLGAPDEVLAWVYGSNLPRQFRLWGLWNLPVDFAAVKQPARNPEVAKVVNKMVASYDWWEQPQVKNTSAEKTDHPCQIPVSGVARILRLTRAASAVDPFMGSGTTGVACVEAGIPFVGVEIEERYFDIACRRIEQAQRQADLFIKPALAAAPARGV